VIRYSRKVEVAVLTTLVLATDGSPRHELHSFLKSIPDLRLLETSGDGLPLGQAPPDLIVLDASTPGPDDRAFLRELATRLPTARCVVLVGSPGQVKAALAAGADRVLLAGFSAAEFFQTLKELSWEEKDDNA
jgi:DNA-binding NarL/FixJ family response regulator